MSYLTMSKNLTVQKGSSDGGFNWEELDINVNLSKREDDNGEVTVVVSGLREEGTLSLEELRSLLEDMEYLDNKK